MSVVISVYFATVTLTVDSSCQRREERVVANKRTASVVHYSRQLGDVQPSSAPVRLTFPPTLKYVYVRVCVFLCKHIHSS